MIKSRAKVSKKEWAPDHFSWNLLDSRNLCIKEEEIPVNGKSEVHFHNKSIQFFYVLEGEAKLILEERTYHLKKNEGIQVLENKKHQIVNSSGQKLIFLLISFPKVQEDDIFV